MSRPIFFGRSIMASGLLWVLMASLAGQAWADEQRGTGHPMPPHAGMGKGSVVKGHEDLRHHSALSPIEMKEELGLSAEQIQALAPLEKEYRKRLITNGADVRVAMIDLGDLLDQPNPDRNAIAAKVDEISGLQKQMMMYRVDTLLKLKEILNPTQYDRFRSRLRAQMEGGMGRRMPGMGGMMGHGHGMMGSHGYGEGYRGDNKN